MKQLALLPGLLLGLLLLPACGSGGGEDVQPAIITNPNVIAPQVEIGVGASFPGVAIIGPGDGTINSVCGKLLVINAYRTDTDLVFRIEDEFGFCWDTDRYEIYIENIRWRGVPGAIILTNSGNPADDTSGFGYFRNVANQVSLDSDIKVTQFVDDATKPWFYLQIPLSLFNFANKADDPRSVFTLRGRIQRFPFGAPTFQLDITELVAVDFVDPN
ncbi:MAG: hypothetical protein ACYTGZ_03580 [Planctomycetota bacterium]|jgi:hypothetical protein